MIPKNYIIEFQNIFANMIELSLLYETFSIMFFSKNKINKICHTNIYTNSAQINIYVNFKA